MNQFIDIKELGEDVSKTHPWLKDLSFVKEQIKKLGESNFYKHLKSSYFIYDVKSPFRNSGMDEKTIREEVSINIFNKKSFDENDLIKNWLEKTNLTPIEREFKKYELEVQGFNSMLSEWEWEQGSAQNRIKTMSAFDVFWKKFEDLRRELLENKQTNSYRANEEPSLIEQYGGG